MATTNPVTNADLSAWERIQNAVVDGANWFGRNVKMIGNAIADYAVKTYEYVKPFFVAIGQFFADKYEIVKEWVKENKDLTVIGLASAGAALILYMIFSSYFCTPEATPAKATA